MFWLSAPCTKQCIALPRGSPHRRPSVSLRSEFCLVMLCTTHTELTAVGLPPFTKSEYSTAHSTMPVRAGHTGGSFSRWTFTHHFSDLCNAQLSHILHSSTKYRWRYTCLFSDLCDFSSLNWLIWPLDGAKLCFWLHESHLECHLVCFSRTLHFKES